MALTILEHLEGFTKRHQAHKIIAEILKPGGDVDFLTDLLADLALEQLALLQDGAFVLLQCLDAEALVPHAPPLAVDFARARVRERSHGDEVVVPFRSGAFGIGAVDQLNSLGMENGDFVWAYFRLIY